MDEEKQNDLKNNENYESLDKDGLDDLDNRKITKIKEGLAAIQSQILRIQKILLNGDDVNDEISEAVMEAQTKLEEEIAGEHEDDVKARVIEGVFDGQNMIGPDGKKYQVPPNYASKSKLVEGDILKLSITDSGGFIYKQIGPTERDRLVGALIKEEDSSDYTVRAGGSAYKVLTASVTYFKGNHGDEAIILVPKNAASAWAAIENIIKKESS